MQVQKESVEPQVVANPEHELVASTSEPVHVPDHDQLSGPSESKTAQPTVESGPQPAGEPPVVHRANTDPAIHAVPVTEDTAKPPAILSAKSATEQTAGKAVEAQLCSAHVRQRSWKKRFLSLRYPVFFGRGM